MIRTTRTIGAAVLLVALSSSVQALACECRPPSAPLEEAAQSDAVFLAKITEFKEIRPNNSFVRRLVRKWLFGAPHGGYEREELLVTFQLIQEYKGVDDNDSLVITALSSGACGYTDFKLNEDFVIYASRDNDGQLHTGLCSRTASASDASEDLSVLGEHFPIGREVPHN